MSDVKVIDAPGYEDFEGVLLMEVPNVLGELMSVVGYEQDGVRDFEVIPSRYVHNP